MSDDSVLDFGKPRVHPDDYPKAGLGEFQRPGTPQVVEDGPRDERLAEQIRVLLQGHEMVDASRVSVQVVNAQAFLIGTADNRYSRQRAEDLARDVDGVVDVVNKISIQPPTEEPGPILSTQEPGANNTGSTQRS